MPETVQYKDGLRLSGDGRIAEHARCRACRYDWRGLDPGGPCPECGEPIESRNTLERSRLLRVDRVWLWVELLGTAAGVSLLVYAAVFAFALVLWAMSGFSTPW
jgi:hypothetical protein